MTTGEKIRKELIRLIKGKATIQVYFATVIAVDESKYTCDVEPNDGGAIDYTVRLKPTIDSDNEGIVTIPEIGSIVLVSTIGNDANFKYVAVFGKVKRYLIKTKANGIIEITEGGILKLNGDKFGGLTKTQELQKQLNINNKLLNAILQVIKTTPIPEPGSGSPSAFQAALNTAVAALSLGSFKDIENENVLHG